MATGGLGELQGKYRYPTTALYQHGVAGLHLCLYHERAPCSRGGTGQGGRLLKRVIRRHQGKRRGGQGDRFRRKAIDMNIPLITNVQVTKTLMRALEKYKIEDLKIEDWEEYRN